MREAEDLVTLVGFDIVGKNICEKSKLQNSFTLFSLLCSRFTLMSPKM